MGVLGGRWGFLTGDLEDMVILDVMDDLILPQGRYPESFVLISLLEVCQEWGVLHGGTWRTLRVPERRLGGRGHPWCPGWSCLTPRKIPWKFCVDIFVRSQIYLQGDSGPIGLSLGHSLEKRRDGYDNSYQKAKPEDGSGKMCSRVGIVIFILGRSGGSFDLFRHYWGGLTKPIQICQ